jgi:hypothetical protein
VTQSAPMCYCQRMLRMGERPAADGCARCGLDTGSFCTPSESALNAVACRTVTISRMKQPPGRCGLRDFWTMAEKAMREAPTQNTISPGPGSHRFHWGATTLIMKSTEQAAMQSTRRGAKGRVDCSAAVSGQSATIEGRTSLVQGGSPALRFHIRVNRGGSTCERASRSGGFRGFRHAPTHRRARRRQTPDVWPIKGQGDSVGSKEQNHDRERYRCDFR